MLRAEQTPCVPNFKPGRAHLKNKFCSVCRRGFLVPTSHVRALSPSHLSLFANKVSTGLWTKIEIGPHRFHARLLNHAKLCNGVPLAVFAQPPPALAGYNWAELPPEWLSPEGDTLRLSIARGTLVPSVGLTRQCAPHVDEMLTLSESGIEPRKGAAPSTSLDPGFKPVPGDALLVIDVQNDFIPGGALEVAGGHEVVPVCNALMDRFDVVVFSQDWHCPGHLSFASSHEGKSPYDSTQMPYGDQTLWPDHCIQGTSGSSFHADLSIPDRVRVVRKGFRKDIDSYSAFFENDQTTPTGLEGYLKDIGVRRVFVCGLAFDFCVRFTAVDAKVKCGFDEVVVVKDATRSVGLPGTVEAADEGMKEAGVKVADSGSLVAALAGL